MSVVGGGGGGTGKYLEGGIFVKKVAGTRTKSYHNSLLFMCCSVT